MTIKIKPLVWEAGDGIHRDKNSWKAETGFGHHYFVIENQWWFSDRYYPECGECNSDDDAKAAAQEDFNNRIMKWIENDYQQNATYNR